MKRILCKTAIFLLLFALLLPTLSGCARETDEELYGTVVQLLEESALVNALCFGTGLSPVKDESEGYLTPGYAEATEASRTEYGVSSVQDITDKIRAVYSTSAAESVESVVFEPVRLENTVLAYRRYFDAEDGEGNLCLMVKKDYEPLAVGSVSYENIRIVKHSRSRAEILTDITVTEGEESRTDKDVSFLLRYEEGWRLDTLTYASIK